MSSSNVSRETGLLAFMHRLTSSTYIYQPETYNSQSPTIILCTWLNAAPPHIVFYVNKYRALVPAARVILIRGIIPNMVYVPASSQKRNLASVISAMQSEPQSPVYLHLFSNSGAQSASTLLHAYRERNLKRDGLPLEGILFDSTPSYGSYSSGYSGNSYEVSRFPIWVRPFGYLLCHFLVIVMRLTTLLTGRLDVLSQSYEDLLDPALIPKAVPRVYLFSKEDKLVKWQDIEGHAANSLQKGYNVRLETFSGTAHCRHGKGEWEGRYWNVVTEFLHEGLPN